METIDRVRLNQLLASEGGPHVTVILPPPERPMDAKNDAIRISNLTREAVSILAENWMPEQEAEDFVKPLRDLGDDEAFLADRPNGVALYFSADSFKLYQLNVPVEQRMVIDRVFHVRPLLECLQDQMAYLVLRMSKKGVTLLDVNTDGVSEVTLEGVPESFELSLGEVTADRGSQTHSAAGANVGGGKQAAVFHGQGGLRDAEKAELTEYLKHLDAAVCSALADRHQCLILAGVDYETAIYRHVSKYPWIAAETVSGNVDHLSAEQVADQAKPIAAVALTAQRDADAEQIRERRHESVATDPERVLEAAFGGRIKTLFINRTANLSGSFDSEKAILRELPYPPSGQPGDSCHDLLESAAVQTLKHGGIVYAVGETDMPIDARMAAALRY